MKKQALLRRAAVSISATGLFLAGLATAQSAHAADSYKGTLTSAKAVTATVAAANDTVSYTFGVENGDHVSIATSASAWSTNGSAVMRLYVPNAAGSSWIFFKQWAVNNGQTPFFDTTAEASGLWKLEVDPTGTTTGSTTFTYAADAYASDVADTTVPPKPRPIMEAGSKYKLATTVAGQNAGGYFHAEQGAHIALEATATSWPAGSAAYGYIYNPSGHLYKVLNLASPTFHELDVDATGYWRFVVDPQGAATGNITLALAADLWKGQLNTNVPVTVKLGVKGQDAWFGAYGVANDDLPIKVTGNNWGTGTAKLWLYAPGASTATFGCDLTGTTKTCTFMPNATGQWRVHVDPQGGSTGETTVTRLT